MTAILYQLANVALVALHVLLSLAFGWCARGRPRGSVVARLCWPLALFFASGILTHAVAAADTAATHAQGWTFAARVVLVLACVPVLWRALRDARQLPTKEQYHATLAELSAAVRQKDLEAAARQAAWNQLDRRNANLNAVCDELRRQVEQLRHSMMTDQDYQELRKRIHDLRNS